MNSNPQTRRRWLTALLAIASMQPVGPLLASDQIPGAPQKRPIALIGGVVHTVSGGTIEKGSVLFTNGKITNVGVDISFPGDAEVIDVTGKHIYPGLIDSVSSIGLIEIESVKASVDTTEVGNLNPNVRAAVAFNPDSEAIPVARANGILTSVIVPSGGLVAGRAAAMMLDGWTWEGMTLQPDVGMVVNWPRFGGGRVGRGGRDAGGESDSDSADRLEPLHSLIREVKAYQQLRQTDSASAVDLRLDSFVPVIDGKLPMLVFANTTKQIQTSVAFAKQYNLKMVLVGGADAAMCAPLLKEAKIPVVISSVYRLPTRRDAPYDAAYTLPSELQEAGVAYSIGGDGRFGASMVRNLPYHASTAVAFGLNEEQALRSITLSPAEIYGVSDRVGSLEVGKDATLFIANGNILETPTQVEKAFIQGRRVDLTSKHTQLNEKYKARYNQAPSKN